MNESTTTTTTTTTLQDSTPARDKEAVLALAGLGRDWASYGLRIAQLALEQSAGTMSKVASALDGIRAQVDATGKPRAS